jgi:hypothetical protein
MWHKNPKYIAARDFLLQEVSQKSLSMLRYSLPKMVFICGGDERYCKNRLILEKYFSKYHPMYLTFRAEDAWRVISNQNLKQKDFNALSMEEWLAGFSDLVIILVESYGTVAELGAFSLSPLLRRKLLPILDKRYMNDISFINTGPIAWIDKDSKYGPSIHADISAILSCTPELDDRLKSKHQNMVSEENVYGKFLYSNKVLLFFILYIIISLGPISEAEIFRFLTDSIEFKNRKVLKLSLAVGVALKIFKEHSFSKEEYFSCIDYSKLFQGHSTQSLFNKIQENRARSLSTLLRIPEFKATLEEISQNVT